MLIFGAFVYFLNLSVRKIIDVLNLKWYNKYWT
jgi:hypothetical protein